jgi:hypothetical protein
VPLLTGALDPLDHQAFQGLAPDGLEADGIE